MQHTQLQCSVAGAFAATTCFLKARQHMHQASEPTIQAKLLCCALEADAGAVPKGIRTRSADPCRPATQHISQSTVSGAIFAHRPLAVSACPMHAACQASCSFGHPGRLPKRILVKHLQADLPDLQPQLSTQELDDMIHSTNPGPRPINLAQHQLHHHH